MPSWEEIFASLGNKTIELTLMANEYTAMAAHFEVSIDSCSNPLHFSNYIRYCSIGDKKCGVSTTHVLIDRTRNAMIGFLSLRATSLIMPCDDISPQSVGRPALEIYQLAVDKNYCQQNYGSFLAFWSIYFAQQLRMTSLGIQYIVLCADAKAEGFYAHDGLGFKRLQDYYTIPRDGSNSGCTPMFLKLSDE